MWLKQQEGTSSPLTVGLTVGRSSNKYYRDTLDIDTALKGKDAQSVIQSSSL